jgi:hypothetical protein
MEQQKVEITLNPAIRHMMAGVLNDMVMTTEELVRNKATNEQLLGFLLDGVEVARRAILMSNGKEGIDEVADIFEETVADFYQQRQDFIEKQKITQGE